MPVLIWLKSYVNLTKPLCLNPWPHPLLSFLGCCAIYICRIQRGCLYYKEYLLSSYWYCLLTSLCITPTLVGVVWTKFTLAPLAPRMSMQLGSGRSIVSLVSLYPSGRVIGSGREHDFSGAPQRWWASAQDFFEASTEKVELRCGEKQDPNDKVWAPVLPDTKTYFFLTGANNFFLFLNQVLVRFNSK